MTRPILTLLLTLLLYGLSNAADWVRGGCAEDLVIDPSGRYVAESGGRVWDTRPVTADLIQSGFKGSSYQQTVSFAPDGESFVRSFQSIGSYDGLERVNTTTGFQYWQLPPSGTLVGVLGGGNEFATHNSLGTTIRSMVDGSIIREYPFRIDWVHNRIGIAQLQYDFTVYDLDSGNLLVTYRLSVDHQGYGWSNNKRWLQFTYGQSTLTTILIDFANNHYSAVPTHGSALATSDDGRWLLQRGSNALHLIDRTTMAMRNLPGTGVLEARFAPDGEALYLVTELGLTKHQLSDMALLSEAGASSFRGCQFSASGRVVACGYKLFGFRSYDGLIEMSFTSTGKPFHSFSLGDSMRTAGLLRRRTDNAIDVLMFPVEQGGFEAAFTVPLAEGLDSEIVVTKKSKRLLLKTGSSKITLFDFYGNQLSNLTISGGAFSRIETVENNSSLVFANLSTNAGSQIETIVLDLATLTEVKRFQARFITVATDGSQLATYQNLERDEIRDATDGQVVTYLTVPEGYRTQRRGAFHPDGRTYLGVIRGIDTGHRVACWDVKTGSVLWTSTTLEDDIRQITISKDGRRYCTMTSDGDVRYRGIPRAASESGREVRPMTTDTP